MEKEGYRLKVGMATFAMESKKLTECLEELANFDFYYLELWAGRGRDYFHFPYRYPREVRRLKTLLNKWDLFPYSIHTPMFSEGLDSLDKESRLKALREIKESLKVLKDLGGEIGVIHPGGRFTPQTEERQLYASLSSLLNLLEYSSQLGLRISVEVMFPEDIGSKIEHLLFFKENTPEELGFCVDTGHAYSGGILEECIEVLGKRINHLHVHDTFKGRDAHLLLGEGEIDWKRFIELLKSIDYHGVFMLELRENSQLTLSEYLKKVKESLGKILGQTSVELDFKP